MSNQPQRPSSVREPIISRALFAAILNVLVVSGVLDVHAPQAIETAVLAVIDVYLVLSARAKVTADRDLVASATARRAAEQGK